MRFRTWFGAAVGAALVATTAARAEEPALRMESKLEQLVGRAGGLRADDVAARAVATSPDLRKHKEEIAEAVAQLDRAVIALFPRLTGSAQYTRLSSIGSQSLGPISIPELRNQTVLEQSITIPLSDYAMRLPQTYKAARLQRESTALNERASRLQTDADARVAYYEWARARLQRAVAEQSVEQARQHRKSVGDLFEVGNASRADVMRIEAQVASNETFLARARRLESVLEEQLRTLMHDDSRRSFEIGEDLRPARPAGADAGLEQALSTRLDVRALGEAAEAARARSSAALAGALPRLSAFAKLTTANPNSRYFPARDQFDSTWAAGLQLTWSPNDVADGRAAAREADAKAAQADAQRDALRDAIRGEVEDAYQSLRAAESALASTARGLEAAEESHRVRRELFLNGRATSVELTDAETELTQARLDAIGARIDHREARVRLDHATGRDIALAN
ncbi:MAG TPA: TolC family protein [Myxococcales bacterium]|jgi:outer membrane protein TolC|nr:TolC family protein [Myxococcales bacterium]